MKKVILYVKSYVFLVKILNKKVLTKADLECLKGKYGVEYVTLGGLNESLEWIGDRPSGTGR